jgi:hypothetical protein
MAKALAGKPFFLVITALSVLLVIAMVYSGLAAPNPFGEGNGDIPQTPRDHTSATNFDLYFGGLFLGKYLLIYIFILIPVISCLYFIGFKKYRWDENKYVNIISSVAGYLVSGAVILCCVGMSVFYFPYQSANKYDFCAVYYSMTQVYAGVPLLVGHFTNTYGLYPHFLNLIFQITGLSVFKFSLVMGLMIGLGFILNFYCLKQFVRNNIILLFGMISVIFLPFLDFKIAESYDSIFSFFPIRYIIPCVLLFLATIYLKNKSQAIYRATSVIMALFVLWNPEFGIISYISWILFNTYNDYYNEEGRPAIKKIAAHWVIGAATLIVVFCIYALLIYLFYGSFPGMGKLWSAILIFGKLGFGLLPMTLLHPWNIVALILILGLVYSISKWYKKERSPKASIVFLITMLGIGFLFYFQGRSHDWSLASIAGISMMLLSILGDELWAEIKDKNIIVLNALFIIFLCIISFSFFEIVTSADKIIGLVYQEEDKKNDALQQAEVENNRDFITTHSQLHENIYVLTLSKYQGLYFDATKRRSAFNPGMIDLFFNSDLTRLENQIIDSPYSVFITPYTFQHLKYMSRTLAAIAATYEGTAANKVMAYATKRAAKIPSKVFFDSAGASVFHRKYTDDRAGAEMRVDDAQGIKPLNLNQEFSVEILFNSSNQFFNMPTLISNMRDSTGFAISRVLNSPNCLFGINGLGYHLPVPYNEWIYCEMNVFPDHFEVYINGELLSTNPLKKPYANSRERLSIGNFGNMHYYVGAISEAAITNNALDINHIKKTWNNINETLGKSNQMQ